MTPIVLQGTLDQYAAESIKEQALSFLTADEDPVFDFWAVNRLQTASLQVLVALQIDLKPQGRAVVLRGVSPQLRELFRISGAEAFFQFSDNQ